MLPLTVKTRAILMMLLHDIVEVDAGDNPIHGAVTAEAQQAQLEAELKAADRLFGLLPSDQGQSLRIIWDEFEAAKTPKPMPKKHAKPMAAKPNLNDTGKPDLTISVTERF